MVLNYKLYASCNFQGGNINNIFIYFLYTWKIYIFLQKCLGGEE